MKTARLYRQAGIVIAATLLVAACGRKEAGQPLPATPPQPAAASITSPAVQPEIYASVRLQADLGELSGDQQEMLKLLIDASEIMDDLYWRQAFRDDWRAWLDALDQRELKDFAAINYGPWDRLNDEAPFVPGVDAKPLGANLYPADITRQEFERWDEPAKTGLYSLVRRDAAGKLMLVPYHVAYASALTQAASLLRQAAELANDKEFAGYLELRADALVTDEYQQSDLAWMDMKSNPVELVIGPIETYEDRLFGYRAAYESYVLLKDEEWSERLAHFADFLPQLQRDLPVPERFKSETPGTDSDLNAYDVLYYAGHSNAGAKTIAINLPNDEQVQLQKGTRRLQLKNAMRAKFEKILVPVADELIDVAQRQYIDFDAFFANTMFHEVAHGLGVKNTINDRGTVREALRDTASSVEEGKADILGLYMITRLQEAGELGEIDLRDNYVTFMAGIFRSVRFGASDAHGRANMVRFNFFKEHGAFVRNADTLTYSVDFERMQEAVNALSELLLTLQGNGDYDGVTQLMQDMGTVDAELQGDLDRLAAAGIPVDIVFEQGSSVLGLD